MGSRGAVLLVGGATVPLGGSALWNILGATLMTLGGRVTVSLGIFCASRWWVGSGLVM